MPHLNQRAEGTKKVFLTSVSMYGVKLSGFIPYIFAIEFSKLRII
jgi:hypothetical protein